jgi:cellulose biosynthesis protein BcsQ
MSQDVRITNKGNRVPVVAFFGTKGGVGKTTIARRFAELVTLAAGGPNVLLLDADVYHRGMTVEITTNTPATCKTVHDYVASQNTSDVEAANMSGLVKGAKPGSGGLYFIPASTPQSEEVFARAAGIGSERLLDILHKVVTAAVQQYDCGCVVIDCGPIIDPYTAGAAMLADRAFIIGQNEPISFSSLKSYPSQLQEFYPDFSTSKMKVIINKVRGWERLEERRLQEDIFAAIPFTLDIVDVSEGIAEVNQMQLMLFEDHIAQVVERVFMGDHPELVPERKQLLPPEWDSLLEGADQLEKAPPIRRLGLLRLLLPIGILPLLLGAVLVYAGTTERHRSENAALRDSLVAALGTGIEGAASQDAADRLGQALTLAEGIDVSDDEALAEAMGTAQEAGLGSLPQRQRGDTSRENLGIVGLLVGLVLSVFGLSCSKKRKAYLQAVQGMRKGGAEWLMSQLKGGAKARRIFDRLRRMAH